MKDYQEEAFKESLSFGKMVEDYVLSRIQKKYPKAFRRDGNHKQWDLYVPETKTKIEVKSDAKSNHTGKFVIETSYGGRPSALTTSTADFWVFFTGYKLIWITKSQIMKAIKESGVRLRKFRGGLDKKEKTAYLLPKYYLEAHATKIDEPLNDLPSNFRF
jgi:hypothetical protein